MERSTSGTHGTRRMLLTTGGFAGLGDVARVLHRHIFRLHHGGGLVDDRMICDGGDGPHSAGARF